MSPGSPFTWLFAQMRAFLRDIAVCLVFFSRLPVRLSGATIEAPDLAGALRALPVAGLIVGVIGALVLPIAFYVGLPDTICAALAVAISVLTCGGLHEDGLADTADGFGGGRTRERKLAIMRDSHIGTYGVLALVISLMLRTEAIATILSRDGPVIGFASMVAAAPVSRALAILPLLCLPAARPDGLGRTAGHPDLAGTLTCLISALFLGLGIPLCVGIDIGHCVLACSVAAAASLVIVGLAHRHIGGHTGDIGGASQQAAEIGYLLAMLLFPDVG